MFLSTQNFQEGDAQESKDSSFPNPFPIVQPINPIEGVIFGLELLLQTNRIFIRAQNPQANKDPLIFEGDEIPTRKYDIIDCDAGRIYYAWETGLNDSGRGREFTIKVADFSGRTVLLFERQPSCISCCLRFLNCCGSTGCNVIVNKPDGRKIGAIQQKYNGWSPTFKIKDEFGNTRQKIKGPDGGDCCYNCNMVVEADFEILTPDDAADKIGIITREREIAIGQEYYGITFPRDITVQQKATLLGSVFAIGILYFGEQNPDIVEEYHEGFYTQKEKERRNSEAEDLIALGLPVNKS